VSPDEGRFTHQIHEALLLDPLFSCGRGFAIVAWSSHA
jgi:hypothetical protein